MSARALLVTGAIAAFLAVGLGAIGAHALEARLDERGRNLWTLAADYHLAHALALVLLGVARRQLEHVLVGVAGWVMLAGIVLFSGSLYALALGAPRAMAMVTPVGGLSFLLGWLLFALGAARAGR